VETFIDHAGRMAFDNGAAYVAAGAPVVEMGYVRVKSARQVPYRLRGKLDTITRAEARMSA
jgi:hypothetical protein